MTKYGSAPIELRRDGPQDVAELDRVGGVRLIATRSASDAVNRSAAPNAPIGVQRPKMTAASAMKPASAGHPVLERPALLEGQVRTRQSGEDATEDDVPVAELDHVDADRLGRLGMLADGPGPQAPARAEEPDLEEDDQEQDRDRDRAVGEEPLEDPADERQVDEIAGQLDAAGRCRLRDAGSAR